jgi:DNA repair photolyase
MSPVLSPSALDLRIRRRPVRQSALFPVCPVVQSPKPLTGSDSSGNNPDPIGVEAPVAAGSSGSLSSCPTADCPPPSPPAHGARRAVGGTRDVAARLDADAAAPLVGIARLAAACPAAETSRKSEGRPEYFFLPVKSILNKCDSKRVPFEWTINPYRGCEFGCKYCYARYTHEYMELDGSEFERKIFVKRDAAPLLAHDVSHNYSFASEKSGGTQPEHIAIGTATDPYQPAEREYRVTRACLEELVKREGLSVSVITKSNLITRDIDVLKKIAERSSLQINITVTTLRTRLARLLEPRAPRPDLRIAAVKELREAGLPVGISASPLLPGITDGEGELEAVAAAAKEADAQWFFSGVLFLMPASAKQFLPFVREKFPRLAKQYDQWYAKNGYAPEEYRRAASERVARLRTKFGFASRPWVEMTRSTPRPQLSLAWNASVGGVTSDGAGECLRSCAAG